MCATTILGEFPWFLTFGAELVDALRSFCKRNLFFPLVKLKDDTCIPLSF